MRLARPLRVAAVTVLAALGVATVPANGASAASPYTTQKVVVPMTFPVVGKVSYIDSFLACRDGCTRRHLGQDLMAAKMTPIVAAMTGFVTYLHRETRVGEGNYLSIRGDNGWSTTYLHINNDTPGTDDGQGTERYAFAPGLRVGSRVYAGQFIAYVGDSGNAESVGSHCHFELHLGDAWAGTAYNAFDSLNAAPRLTSPVPPGRSFPARRSAARVRLH